LQATAGASLPGFTRPAGGVACKASSYTTARSYKKRW